MFNRSALLALLALSWGCSNQCPQIRADYDQRVEAEKPFVTRTEAKTPTHFGVTLRSTVLNRIVQLALQDGLAHALDLADTIELSSGQALSIKTDGAGADLAVYADKACDHCLRVAGKLDGTLSVKVPVLPIQRVPLNGTFSLVAPVEFARNDKGNSEVRLNLEKMAEIGKSSLDAQVAQLPPTWANVLKGPLSEKLMKAVAAKLGAVTLLEFNGPGLGVEGLEIFPTDLKTDAAKGLVYLGFGSNLAAEDSVPPILDLTANQNAAISISPSILVPALQAALKASKIARRYTDNGKDNPTGPLHVTLQSFTLGETANDTSLKFRLSNMPEDGSCYWVDAEAVASMGLANNKFSMDVKSVELTDSSLPGLVLAMANWSAASFVGEGRRVLAKSLSENIIEIPGSKTTLKGSALTADSHAIVLRGNLNVTPTKP